MTYSYQFNYITSLQICYNRGKWPMLPSFDDMPITGWNAQDRYGVSKLLCHLFVVKLVDYVKGEDVIINMADLGLTKGTALSRDARGAVAIPEKVFFSVAGRPTERGAATYLDAVLRHGKQSHGCFLYELQDLSVCQPCSMAVRPWLTVCQSTRKGVSVTHYTSTKHFPYGYSDAPSTSGTLLGKSPVIATYSPEGNGTSIYSTIARHHRS